MCAKKLHQQISQFSRDNSAEAIASVAGGDGDMGDRYHQRFSLTFSIIFWK